MGWGVTPLQKCFGGFWFNFALKASHFLKKHYDSKTGLSSTFCACLSYWLLKLPWIYLPEITGVTNHLSFLRLQKVKLLPINSFNNLIWMVISFSIFADLTENQFLVCKINTSHAIKLMASTITINFKGALLVQVLTSYHLWLLIIRGNAHLPSSLSAKQAAKSSVTVYWSLWQCSQEFQIGGQLRVHACSFWGRSDIFLGFLQIISISTNIILKKVCV